MRSNFVLCSVSAAIALTGCATASKDISASYTSPLQYQSFDCTQLVAEGARIQGRVNEVGGRLDQAAANDKQITGVGLILFWPALFFLGGTKQQEADFARLKGEYDAVQQAMVQKRCGSGELQAGAPAASTPAPSATQSASALPVSQSATQASPVATQAPPLAPASPPPVAPVSPAQVPQPSSAPPTASPAAAPSVTNTGSARVGQDSHNVERMPEVKACSSSPRADLSSKGPGVETYMVRCNSGDVLVVRCEMGSCRVLK